jgi:hypothetical protein
MRQFFSAREDDSHRILASLEQEAQSGMASVGAIAERLSHPDLQVRIKAAQSLGEIGDPAAIPKLQHALRQSYLQRSVWRHALAGWALTTLIVLASAALFLLAVIVCRGAPTADHKDYTRFGDWLIGLRRDQEPFVCACITALSRIAERDATPSSRAIVPFLQGIAVDPLHHSFYTRTSALRAAERIEAVTAQIKQIPLPSTPPSTPVAELPLAASGERTPTTSQQWDCRVSP